MKNVTWIVLAGVSIAVMGCAGAQLKSEWQEKRGYADSDVSEIMDQYAQYNNQLNQARLESNKFNTAPVTNAEARLKTVFCSCVKKMGDSCRKKEGSKIDHALWVKANAVDMALVGNLMAYEASQRAPAYDAAECN